MTEEIKIPDYKNLIEALLFASGRYIDVDTLLSLTGASDKEVLVNNIERLKKEYEERNSPMMITEENNGWKLTVREPYLPLVRKIVSETELPKTVLETLAVVAWKAPVLQSDVVNVRHNKAYDHIALLDEMGFIKKELKGRSYLISLTEKFYEYFDVEGSKDIREVFNKVIGKASPQKKVEEFTGQNAPEIATLKEDVKFDDSEFSELEESKANTDYTGSEKAVFSELEDNTKVENPEEPPIVTNEKKEEEKKEDDEKDSLPGQNS